MKQNGIILQSSCYFEVGCWCCCYCCCCCCCCFLCVGCVCLRCGDVGVWGCGGVELLYIPNLVFAQEYVWFVCSFPYSNLGTCIMVTRIKMVGYSILNIQQNNMGQMGLLLMDSLWCASLSTNTRFRFLEFRMNNNYCVLNMIFHE